MESRIAAIQGPSATVHVSPADSGSTDFASILSQYSGTGASDGPSAQNPLSGTPFLLPANYLTGRLSPNAVGAPSGSKINQFIDLAIAQNGDSYVMGHEVSQADLNPQTFDCSELIEWAANKVGVSVPDGSWLQYLDLKQRNALMPVEQALETPGALLFSFSSEPQAGGGRPSSAHVAISLGDGRTIEARGKDYGVGIFGSGDRFEYAGMIPEFFQ